MGGQRHTSAALPRERTGTNFIGKPGRVRKISSPPGFDPRTVQPVASRYTDYRRMGSNRQECRKTFSILYIWRPPGPRGLRRPYLRYRKTHCIGGQGALRSSNSDIEDVLAICVHGPNVGFDTRTERLSIVTPRPHDGVHFSIRCFLITSRALLFGRFPGFPRLSFRTDQHLDKDEYGALIELQGKTTVFGEKRIPCHCDQPISHVD